METKKKTSPDIEPEVIDIDDDNVTVTTPAEELDEKAVTVPIVLPLLDEGDDIRVDQSEQVTINDRITNILRGERVEVRVPVFLLLKQRYPLI